MNEQLPPIFVLAQHVASWCMNRAEMGDVETDVLADNFAKLVKKIIDIDTKARTQ